MLERNPLPGYKRQVGGGCAGPARSQSMIP
jgi:hypothetical protein